MSRSLVLALLLACFALAGCATEDKHSDDSRFGGFYTGATGGAMN